jgi:hypothetical protein
MIDLIATFVTNACPGPNLNIILHSTAGLKALAAVVTNWNQTCNIWAAREGSDRAIFKKRVSIGSAQRWRYLLTHLPPPWHEPSPIVTFKEAPLYKSDVLNQYIYSSRDNRHDNIRCITYLQEASPQQLPGATVTTPVWFEQPLSSLHVSLASLMYPMVIEWMSDLADDFIKLKRRYLPDKFSQEWIELQLLLPIKV